MIDVFWFVRIGFKIWLFFEKYWWFFKIFLFERGILFFFFFWVGVCFFRWLSLVELFCVLLRLLKEFWFIFIWCFCEVVFLNGGWWDVLLFNMVFLLFLCEGFFFFLELLILLGIFLFIFFIVCRICNCMFWLIVMRWNRFKDEDFVLWLR